MRKFSFRFSLVALVLVTFMGAVTRPHTSEAVSVPCGRSNVDVVLLLDRTGSISDENRDLIQAAAQDLVTILLNENPDNRVGLIRFGSSYCQETDLSPEEASLGEVLHELSGELPALAQTLNEALSEPSCGGTNLEDPLRDAEEVLASGTNPHKALVLISDGQPNLPFAEMSPTALALAAAQDLKINDTRIFTIAFDASSESDQGLRDLLAQMASEGAEDNTIGDVDANEQAAENQDGDDFFIAPQGSDLAPVFRNIGDVILCESAPELSEIHAANDQQIQESTNPQSAFGLDAGQVQGGGGVGCSLRKF